MVYLWVALGPNCHRCGVSGSLVGALEAAGEWLGRKDHSDADRAEADELCRSHPRLPQPAQSSSGTCNRSLALPGAEDLIHDLSPGRDHRPQFASIDHLGSPGAGMPGQPRDLLDRNPLITHHADEGSAQFLRHPPRPEPCGRRDLPELSPQIMRLKRRPHGGGEHQAVLLPLISRPRGFFCLMLLLTAKGLDSDLRELQGPPRPVGLGIAMRTDGPPYHDRPSVQIHVPPRQRPRLFRADTRQ